MDDLDERDRLPQGFGEDDPLECGEQRVILGQLVPVRERDRHVDRLAVRTTSKLPFENLDLVLTIQGVDRGTEDQAGTFFDCGAQRRRVSQDDAASVARHQPLDRLFPEPGIGFGLDRLVVENLPDFALRLQECLERALAAGEEQAVGDLHGSTPSGSGFEDVGRLGVEHTSGRADGSNPARLRISRRRFFRTSTSWGSFQPPWGNLQIPKKQ